MTILILVRNKTQEMKVWDKEDHFIKGMIHHECIMYYNTARIHREQKAIKRQKLERNTIAVEKLASHCSL